MLGAARVCELPRRALTFFIPHCPSRGLVQCPGRESLLGIPTTVVRLRLNAVGHCVRAVSLHGSRAAASARLESPSELRASVIGCHVLPRHGGAVSLCALHTQTTGADAVVSRTSVAADRQRRGAAADGSAAAAPRSAGAAPTFERQWWRRTPGDKHQPDAAPWLQPR